MSQHSFSRGAPNNPIVQVIAVIVAVLVAIGAVFLGAVILSFFIGFAIIGWVILTIRLWWLRRQVRSGGGTSSRSQTGEIVEVEYTVVEERPVDHRQDRGSE